MLKVHRLAIVLLLLAVGALLVFWYRGLEWTTRLVDHGPTAEARQNPVLALQRLLEQRNIPVALVRGFAGLEQLRLEQQPIPPGDALVLLNTAHSLRATQVDALWRWVEEGGRLVAAADNPFFTANNRADPLLDRLGLALTGDDWDLLETAEEEAAEAPLEQAAPTPPPAPAGPATNADEKPQEICSWTYVAVPVRLDLEPHANLMLEMGSGVAFTQLNESSRALAAYDEQVFLAHQRLGAGDIYALPSMTALDNDNIHCQDNAYVFWQLLREADKVWLVVNTDGPSFWGYLWQLSPLGCAAFLAALAAWLWYRVPRFGPVFPVTRIGRRQFLDHIQATAQFTLRHQGSSTLVETLRDELWHRLRLRQPGFRRLTRTEQIETVSKLSGMAAADVQLALFRELPLPDPLFVEAVQRLQHLRTPL